MEVERRIDGSGMLLFGHDVSEGCTGLCMRRVVADGVPISRDVKSIYRQLFVMEGWIVSGGIDRRESRAAQ